MTRKDYELIAKALRSALKSNTDNDQSVGILKAAREVASALTADNSRFDQGRFMAAVLDPTPQHGEVSIGDGATYSVGSNRYPATVVSFTRFLSGARKWQISSVTVQQDEATVVSGSMHDGSAEYEYSPNPHAARQEFKVNKAGRFVRDGRVLHIGQRRRYEDPSF
jgi:hypothetical protein